MRIRKNLLNLGSLALVSSTLGFGAVPAAAKKPLNLVVDLATDSATGVCRQKPNGKCNLRAAIAKAVEHSGIVNITLAVDSQITGGVINITAPAETLAPFVLSISSDLPRAVTGNGSSALFNISSNVNVNLLNVNISQFAAYDAGAITNAGNLSLVASSLTDNKASCFGNGAMTAFATCYAGAVLNSGTLTLGEGSRIERNRVDATAGAAANTNANASGGAIVSSGTLVFDGNVLFADNVANAASQPGYHGNMPGGSYAAASAGALANSGAIEITANGEGKCQFVRNQAIAVANAPVNGQTVQSSRGGAISTNPLANVDLATACTFEANAADQDADVAVIQ